MARWFHSLQFRMVLGFTVVLALALAGVSTYVGIAAEREVDRFEARQDEARAARVQQLVCRFYSDRRDWSELQPLLDEAGPVSGRRIIVTDQKGEVVGDSHRFSNGLRARPKDAAGQPGLPPRRLLPVYVDNRQVGSFSVVLDT